MRIGRQHYLSFAGAVGAIFLTGCIGSSNPFADLQRQDGETPGIHLDPDLSTSERSIISSDVDQLNKLELDGAKVKYFSDLFGGPDSSNVNAYLSERVHWIVSPRKDLDNSVVELDHFGANASSSSGASSTPQVVATNIGAAIWFSSVAADQNAAGIQIGQSLVEIRSTRAGVIQLGDAYTSSLANPLLRVSTLVHEARHSDCTGGVSRQDLAMVKAGKDPVHKDCGHLHVNCPAGHPYAGYPACDDHPWGAYAVETDFMAAVSRSCLNCTAQEQNTATVIFADAASRVLNLDDLLSGKLGAPDMSSSDRVY